MSETIESWKEDLSYSCARASAALVQVIGQLVNDIALLDKRLMTLEARAEKISGQLWGMEERLVKRSQMLEGRVVVLERGVRGQPFGLPPHDPQCAHEYKFGDVGGWQCKKCGGWVETLGPGVAIYGDGPSATPTVEQPKEDH